MALSYDLKFLDNKTYSQIQFADGFDDVFHNAVNMPHTIVSNLVLRLSTGGALIYGYFLSMTGSEDYTMPVNSTRYIEARIDLNNPTIQTITTVITPTNDTLTLKYCVLKKVVTDATKIVDVSTPNSIIRTNSNGTIEIPNAINPKEAVNKSQIDSITSTASGHIAQTSNVHGSTFVEIPNRIIERDANGRAKVVKGVALTDIANMQNLEDFQMPKITENDGTSLIKMSTPMTAWQLFQSAEIGLSTFIANPTQLTDINVNGENVSWIQGKGIVAKESAGRGYIQIVCDDGNTYNVTFIGSTGTNRGWNAIYDMDSQKLRSSTTYLTITNNIVMGANQTTPPINFNVKNENGANLVGYGVVGTGTLNGTQSNSFKKSNNKFKGFILNGTFKLSGVSSSIVGSMSVRLNGIEVYLAQLTGYAFAQQFNTPPIRMTTNDLLTLVFVTDNASLTIYSSSVITLTTWGA